MLTSVETVSEKTCSEQLCGECDRTYTMKGSYAAKALETYHMILAPSFRCNIECKHCYLPDHNSGGLSRHDVLRLINEWSEIVVAECGSMGGIFHLKGGEPLILPYLNDVLVRLEELKTLRFMMTTNGVIDDWNVLERLDRLNTAVEGGVQVIVSIDGSNDAVNSQLRGTGNFKKAVAFVRHLRETGITVFLNNVIHQGNLNDVEKFIDLALKLDVQQVNFLSFVPKGRGNEMPFGRLNPLKVSQRIDAVWKRGNERVRGLLAGSLSDIRHTESCGTPVSHECVGGYRGLLYIIPDGTAYSCPNLNYANLEAGNIHRGPLTGIHDSMIETVYSKICTLGCETRGQYLCKGVKLLQNSKDYLEKNLAKFRLRTSGSFYKDGMSYCFSRNF